ncbi:xylan 1,4-beta-xylosidase [Actinoplanes tereljensis]|uniref:Xylan 1,4-beta-xylosidase n=1 Tax=Paractinoplanes tereljensis TaxID=571912 RepID=A0A919TZ14_9ACTN|nr:glycoside hydrolase family 43 protein [Actinoplanes tereljensis]GIF26734.1 xylan 1,4-beta-xylosidase [Actinoplanes tereljensis]
MTVTIRNPVLPGSHPDPSILRVGDDFYLATSTFEWHPGVQVHHSRDLVHWRAMGGVLTEPRLLDLTGVPDSGGVWAPDLTYANGLFHLVYGVVDNYAFGYKDVSVRLTTAPRIEGPWSDPVPLPGRGFDPSLFHDEDGSTWLVNMVFDDRPDGGFGGIEIQRLTGGDPVLIAPLTARGVTEGPHLYRRDGWYYLLVAEGGTGYEHGALVLRSRELLGPYEPDPAGELLTSRDDPDRSLQKAGHGCLVSTPAGEWFVAHLVARPYSRRGRCVLGRETALQRVEWTGGWPRVPGAAPAVEVPGPDLPPHPWPPEPKPWNSLRRPVTPDWAEAGPRIRIRGGQSPYGLRAPSLLARRVTDRQETLAVTMEFHPGGIHQAAGITAYYNSRNWYYLAVTAGDLVLTASSRGRRTVHHTETGVPDRLGLWLTFDGPVLRFARDTGTGWRDLGLELDATVLSDENADEIVDGQVRVFGFTGAFAGLWVQDLAGEGCHADFTEVCP